MKDKIYEFLVNRLPGIRERYLKYREEEKPSRWRALFRLLQLNFQYYVLFCRKMGKPELFPDRKKRLNWEKSESALFPKETPEKFVKRLAAYDVISFDVFDTLIFRSLSSPQDVFLLVGEKLNCPNFKGLRIETERKAREEGHNRGRGWEVTLEEIWEVLERETGIPKDLGMETEWNCEKSVCFANPYMLEVARKLLELGKRLISVSDMYLGKEYQKSLLEHCGYEGFEDCFVSCDYRASKQDGSLYEIIGKRLGRELAFAHVGDHEHSDCEEAKKHGITPFWYPNVNQMGRSCRPEDMSAVTGSFYRGIVNSHLYNGLSLYSMEYEYGFVYGGLFVAGYCRFIHSRAKAQGADKILFFSRDGAVLLLAYRLLYPEDAGRTEYAYWSRLAAAKLGAAYYKEDYFRRFLVHKAGRGYSVRNVITAMELTALLPSMCSEIKIVPEEKLTNKNLEKIKKYLCKHWDTVLSQYQPQSEAGKLYYEKLLKGIKKAVTVDIGWAGSGAVILDTVVNRIWHLDCRITGLLAGTNSSLGPEPSGTEPFLFSGKLDAYLYSQGMNKDLWRFHDPAQGHNLYWELLLGAPEGSLKGFYPDVEKGWICLLKENRTDPERIRQIHQGILDFIHRFILTEKRLGQQIPISGRDAYAPMMLVESERNKKFRKVLEGLLDEIPIA